ncbi:peptidoglycan-binding protein [Shimazuella kribbensis]|uniref:peptidoglycan-binding protein n=1 Tax=Shimazuella kribbensis TaxID=139808 RepID=UPI00041B39E5|nr:peptidoglycan-binding protein [Shimazuella kribbensis]
MSKSKLVIYTGFIVSACLSLFIFLVGLGMKLYHHFTDDDRDIVNSTKQIVSPRNNIHQNFKSSNQSVKKDNNPKQSQRHQQTPSSTSQEKTIVKQLPKTEGQSKPKKKTTSAISREFPGKQYFKMGSNNKYVTQLGYLLINAGFGKYYTKGPTPNFTVADQKNCQEFQEEQGWRGSNADGYPGEETWKRLILIWDKNH